MPLDPVALERVRAAIGIEAGPQVYPIEEEYIRRFAEAIGDLNPAYLDEDAAKALPAGGIIAPPTFLRSCLPPPLPVDIPAITGLHRILEGGSEWEFLRPVRPGERIGVTIKLVEAREREGRLGTMLITTSLLTYRGADGAIAATQTLNRILY